MRSRRILLALATLVVMAVVGAMLLWPAPSPTTATGGNSIVTAPLSGAGPYTSLALDAGGFPVVSFYATTSDDLKVLHCDDPNCSGGGESITAPDTAGDVGRYTSLVLDASGNPVVSYWDWTNWDLKVLHCNDPNCSGGDESITSHDTAGSVGDFGTSLALDASGNPVVSYHDSIGDDLRLLHCNDPNCSGDDESITSPDTVGDVGLWTSLALDASGNPVVSYQDSTNRDLKVLHCNDPNCSGGDESITSPDTVGNVGNFTSLELDSSGNPVITHADNTNGVLKVVHCNDPNCSGADETITVPDTDGWAGGESSLTLDTAGNPVVSYVVSSSGDLRVLRCNDPNCAGGDDSVASPDTEGAVGWSSSLMLDSDGNPVVSYYDLNNRRLKILHCLSPLCDGAFDSDGDGCFDVNEKGMDETLGGLRDFLNPWDYFNPTNDGLNRIDDVLAVVDHYFLREGEPGYEDGKYDRSYVGPNDWNLGPPDGQVLVDDILHAVKQYFHDCGTGVPKPTVSSTPTGTPTVTPTP